MTCITLATLGVKGPGQPPDVERLRHGWMAVYLALMLLKSTNTRKQAALAKLHELLVEANELVSEIIETPPVEDADSGWAPGVSGGV